MRRSRFGSLCVAGLAALCLSPPTAGAQESPPESRPSPPFPPSSAAPSTLNAPMAPATPDPSEPTLNYFEAEGGVLGVDSSNMGPAFGYDMSVLHRWSNYIAGLEGDVEGQAFGYSRVGAGITTGAVFDLSLVQVDLRPDVGVGCYHNVGGSVFTAGASGCVPYAGGRLGLTLRVPTYSKRRIGVGLWLIYAHDLWSTQGIATTTFLGTSSQSVSIGGDRFGLTIGGVVPLL